MLSISAGSDPGYLTKEVSAGAEHYYLRSIELQGEPPGYWLGDGIADLGLSGTIDNDVFTDLYTDFIDPRKRDEMYARIEAIEHPKDSEAYAKAEKKIRKECRLGDAPRNYEKAYEKRLEKNLAAAEGRAPGGVLSPERVKAIEIQTRKEAPSATHYYDLTFSAPKSWSVAHASLQVKAAEAREAGDLETAERFSKQADQLWDCWKSGVQAGIEHMQEEAGYTRKGHHGQKIDGRTSGEYVKTDKFIVGAFAQHTSRQDDPQLHVHAPVLNKVLCRETDPVTGREREVWRALDGTGLFRHKQAAGHLAERVAEQELERVMGWRVEMRPDGKAREIVGIDQDLRDSFSSRRVAITAEVADISKAFEEKYGVAPSPYTLARISEDVSLRQRKGKKHDAVSRETLLQRWEDANKTRFRESLAEVPDRIAHESAVHDLHRPAKEWDAEVIQQRAIAAVQEQKPTWTRPDLIVELNRQLPDTLGGLERDQVRDLLNQLADDALSPTADNGVICTKAPALVEIAPELQRTDGTFKYDPNPKTFDRYATEEHLKVEERLAEFAGKKGAPTVPAELVEEVIERRGLKGKQAAFVREAATSGRKVDLLVGPAGAGKSFTMAALTEVWESHEGRQVIGLASGERAAQVLRDEGIDNVSNISILLVKNKAMAEGKQVDDAERYRIPKGALVIVDESGMTNNADMDAVRALVEASGAKMIPAGDHHQLTSVGAGGMFAQWVEDAPGVHVLDQVRRFRDTDPATGEKKTRQWEADASLQLRKGDSDCLAAYELHGRFDGGEAEEMTNRAYRAWMTDHFAKKNPLLIASDNKQVAELSAKVRADLVLAGEVSEHGVVLRTVREEYGGIETKAGVGDKIQMRRNNRRITADNGQDFATNRVVATVTGISDNGALMVQLGDGARMHLPASYVTEHVELAYAATVYGAQGRTVGVCHSLVDESTNREALYVMLTRGEADNHAWVITHRAEQNLKREDVPHHLAKLDSILQRTGLEPTATKVIEAELERRENLAVLEPVWSGVKEQDAAKRYGTVLLQTMGEADYERAAGSEAYGTLMRLAQYVEEQGVDVEDLLVRTVRSRELETAEDVSKVLHDRLKKSFNLIQRDERKAEEAEQREAVAEQARKVDDAIGAAQAPVDPERMRELAEAAAPSETHTELMKQSLATQMGVETLQAGTGEEALAQQEAQLAAVLKAAEEMADAEVEQLVDTPAPEAETASAPEDNPHFAELMRQQEAFSQGVEVLHAGQDSEVRARQDAEHAARREALDSYTARTPQLDGDLGRMMQEWAVEMDERTERLGHRVAEDQPAWAIDRLGPVPEDPIARADWEQKAGRVERYREAHGYDHETNAIGQAPPKGSVEAYADWERARWALGVDEREADIARASDETLQQMVERAEREESWAPPYVGDEMQAAYTAERKFADQATQLRINAESMAAKEAAEHETKVVDALHAVNKASGSPQWQALQQAMALSQVPTLQANIDPSDLVRDTMDRAETSQGIAETMGERAQQLREIHETRERWSEETQPVRDEADLARVELERRSPTMEPEPETADTATTTAPSPQPSTQDELLLAMEQAREAQQILAERAAERAEREQQQPVQPELSEEQERERLDRAFDYEDEYARIGRDLATADHETEPTAPGAPEPAAAPEPAPAAPEPAPEPPAPAPPAPDFDHDIDM
ncbi:MobF family relaxase [Streptomyces sp. NPDC001339]|uniref:MobF family relaxase n=1 Tax=Streptomyces sp. NPDC001339 TaxID=3364563 RepID=UPI00368DE401